MSEPTKAADHDFRKGMWGHKMHGFTWRVLPDRIERPGLFRKPIKHNRASVMVHSMRYPRPGETVIYTGGSGFDRIATIAEVDPCGDPDDMFTLVLEDFREAALPHKDPTHD